MILSPYGLLNAIAYTTFLLKSQLPRVRTASETGNKKNRNAPVALQRQELVARHRVPHLARPVITARDELIARLVECAIC